MVNMMLRKIYDSLVDGTYGLSTMAANVLLAKNAVTSVVFGNSALKTLIDTADTVIDNTYAIVNHVAHGNAALKTLIDTANNQLGALVGSGVKVIVPTPATAPSQATVGVGANVYGAWVEMIAATPETWKLSAVTLVVASDAADNTRVQIGVGAPAAEVPLVTLLYGPGSVNTVIPISDSAVSDIPNGSRLAVRISNVGGGGADTADVIIHTHVK